jgi:hypothetical protein
MTVPNYNPIPLYANQYVLVQYENLLYGVCHINFTKPPGNTDPTRPFTSVDPWLPGAPQQEGHLLAWAQPANNLLGVFYSTATAALTHFHRVVGGWQQLGLDIWSDPLHNPNNPFHDQLRPDDFDETFHAT